MRVEQEGLAAPGTDSAPRAMLGLREAVALIVGVVIGAGIFKSPAMVAGMSGSAGWMFAAWILGGVISLIGALCYAELTTAYSHAGGDYHFLHRAYGRNVAFLFGWARFAVITTGSIALLAFVFGDYMQQVLPLSFLPGGAGSVAWACAVIVVLSLLNLRGIRAGALAQTWLTLAEIGGLLLIVGAAAFFTDAPAAAPAEPAAAPASFGLAMVFVLLTYGGWNEAAYISAEVRDGRRNMVRALTLSILIITALYLLVAWAYWKTLGMQGMAGSEALAADVMRRAFGPAGEKAISLLVAISALTSINATMIVGARTGYAMGRDWPLLEKLGRWDGERGTPSTALLIQSAAALLLVGVGAAAGGGFKAMVEFTAPVFWLFFLLTGISLFVLRRREPSLSRPFRVPLYPVLPLLFCATCAYMLWSSLSYVYSQSLGGLNAAWIGVAVLAIGLLLLALIRRSEQQQRRHKSLMPFESR
ncbi:APC family permease [Noviherbaspirillum aridicola]|uniref:Amino acid transporter n=1 Tax=Noviherbaspirillum aridicola TaxID=2849687 RepID=A0ABQ4Q6I4_9BURK|nr:amino acid permease [Noviherbaspirillum aridicola]GIZ52827.1 amino acid transporter [Noviherbaspirillum aridicola]